MSALRCERSRVRSYSALLYAAVYMFDGVYYTAMDRSNETFFDCMSGEMR